MPERLIISGDVSTAIATATESVATMAACEEFCCSTRPSTGTTIGWDVTGAGKRGGRRNTTHAKRHPPAPCMRQAGSGGPCADGTPACTPKTQRTAYLNLNLTSAAAAKAYRQH
jgi:hypothetical protein